MNIIKDFYRFVKESYYDDIIKSYGKDFTKMDSKRNVLPDNNGYYEHIPSKGIAEKLLVEYYKPGFKMLDIGCGFGNILKLSNEIGYESYGIEINEKLKKYHKGLNVIYGDVLSNDFPGNFFSYFDIIYLYRPIEPLDKCDKLFEIIHDNCKDSCIIIYILPSQLNLNLRRKFKFKYFPVMSKRMIGKFDINKKNKYEYYDTGKRTEYPFDNEYKENYSILTPKRGIKDLNIKNIITKVTNVLKEYSTSSDSDYYVNQFVAKTEQIDDFMKKLELAVRLIPEDLKLIINWRIEPKKELKNISVKNGYKINQKVSMVKNKSKGSTHISGKLYYPFDIDIINKSADNFYLDEIKINILYQIIDGEYYEYWNPFGRGYNA